MKDKKTPAQKFSSWVSDKYPNTRISSTNREGSKHHSKGTGVDMTGIEDLSEEDQNTIFKKALSMGMRVGQELQGKIGKGGYTGAHYHFDSTYSASPYSSAWRWSHFTRGAETGGTTNATRNTEEQKVNREFKDKINKLHEELRMEERQDSVSRFPELEPLLKDSNELSTPELMNILLDTPKEQKREPSFKELTAMLASVDPSAEGAEEKVKGILEGDPVKAFMPQITKDTPIIADTDTSSILPKSKDIDKTEDKKEHIYEPPELDSWGAEPTKNDNFIQEIRDLTLDGMGNDLVNNFIDSNIIGLLGQEIIRHTELNHDVDTSFDLNKSLEEFKDLVEGLDDDSLDIIAENSFNRHDFITNASIERGKRIRRIEAERYMQDHPALSITNKVGNFVMEAASMMPIGSAVNAATKASKIKKLSDIASKSALRGHVVGELAEQGIYEIAYSKYDKDYEFDPIMFAAGLGVGVGIKQAIHTSDIDKALRELIDNEKGFINISTDEGSKLIDEVVKNVKNKQAHQLVEELTKRKTAKANEIRLNLKAEKAALRKSFLKTKYALKQAKKSKDKAKIKSASGRLQNITRKIKRFDERLPEQIVSLARGDHPKLKAVVNPDFSIKKIAKEIGIPKEKVSSLSKSRQFLGLDNPNVNPDFVFEGEKAYQSVMRKQLREISDNRRLNMNEHLRKLAGTDTVRKMDDAPVIGRLQLGDKLRSLAETDGPVSRFLFNKGNLFSSDNPYVSSFYNWGAPDGGGRQGMSRIRAIESQQKYANIWGGSLMDIYHTHGDTLYRKLKGEGKIAKLKGFLSPDEYETLIEPFFNQRLQLGAKEFRIKHGNDIADIVDEFAKDYNKLMKSVLDRLQELEVEGVDFDFVEDWFKRSWDFRKARGTDIEDLQDTVFRAMKSHTDSVGLKVDDKTLMKHAKRFSHGIRNADITNIEAIASDHIKLLDKWADNVSPEEAKIIRKKLLELQTKKANNKAGDLARRTQMDTNVKLANGEPLSSLFEDNIINTQKRYFARMAGRASAAEHGIKNIDSLDDWVNDAVAYEIKLQAKKGVKDPKSKAKFVEAAMRQDVRAIKNGGMTGLHDLPDDTASDMVRLVNKYNYARLMQNVGISAIPEMGTAFVEAGVANTSKQLFKALRNNLHELYSNNPKKYTSVLTDELRAITGIGLEDFAFSSKGMSKANRIVEKGSVNKMEKFVDSMGRVTHSTFGWIERATREATANSLAIKWANYFTDKEKGGVVGAFFGSNGYSNRVLENSGLGKVDASGVFTPNEIYDSIKSNMVKHASFDDSGSLLKLNLDKWDSKTAHSFGDVLYTQAGHITVNPDATTMALWQSTPVGRILNQFRSFTINATTKVMGHAVGNAVISSNRGDQAEMIKAVQKIFWGTALGILSVSLRQGIQRAGGDKEVDLFDEGFMKAAAIGLSRSSIIGNIPTIADTISGRFGYDPIFEKSSSIGRSKNFFNLATTPTGQVIGGAVEAGDKALQGDFKGSGMKLLKTSPVYRQIGAQQIFNFIEKEK